MKVLLVCPAFPVTYWGFEYTRPFTGKRAAYPPLGLITVAALLPEDCWPRLVDLNIEELRDEDFRWADLVVVGAQIAQSQSFHEVVARAKRLGKPVLAGGPYPTTSPEACADADHLLLGEAEVAFPSLFAEIRAGRGARSVNGSRAEMSKVPIPRYDLLALNAYTAWSVQFSRGCPFQCEFCDIIEIFGRVPRTKPPAQLLAELDAIYRCGHRGALFIVDDNFIGNKRAALVLARELEPWQRARRFPFDFYTEASVNLATERELVAAMVRAGFSSVFLGIETPSPEALEETHKRQNLHLRLDEAVETLTRAGLEVMAGFIVGFDADDEGAFERQRDFIQRSPIALAMVGLLTALPGTQLTRRLEREGRMERRASGDQFMRPNFRTRLDPELMLKGYGELLANLYSPEAFYARSLRIVERRGPSATAVHMPSWSELGALLRSMVRHGLHGPSRKAYWRLLWAGLRRSHNFRRAVALAIMGEHMRRYTNEDVLPRLERERAGLAESSAAIEHMPMPLPLQA